jgi:ribose transport system substrate-binding protein
MEQATLRKFFIVFTTILFITIGALHAPPVNAQQKTIVYMTPSLEVGFWRAMSAGVDATAKLAGYTVEVLDSNNDGPTQLKNVQDAIAKGAVGIVISPTDSSTAPSVLDLAEKAGIPVVICDIGTTRGNYVSFVGSDNLAGARGIGDASAAALKAKNWLNGSFGIIAIPQTRKNGQLRTEGFRAAMKAAGVTKEVPMQQMKTFTADESFRFAQDMLTANPDLRLIFVQSDQQAIGAARAVKAARRDGEVLVAAFDGTPELLQGITNGSILGSGMQQPYLMGSTAAKLLTMKLTGGNPPKEELVEIMTVTKEISEINASQIKLNFAVIPSKTSDRALYPWLPIKCLCGERIGSCFSCTQPISTAAPIPTANKPTSIRSKTIPQLRQ